MKNLSKTKIIAIIISLVVLIIPIQLHFAGLMLLFMNNTGGMIGFATIIIMVALMTVFYKLHFSICYFVVNTIFKFLDKINPIEEYKKIYITFSYVMPILFCTLYMGSYLPYSPPALLFNAIGHISHFNTAGSLELKCKSYDNIAEFTLSSEYSGSTINFFTNDIKSEVISKISFGKEYEYRVYEKYSSDDFWYFINSANELFKDNPDRNLAHLQHENLHSLIHFKYDDMTFVTVSYPNKSFARLTEFIKIGDDYYISNYAGFSDSSSPKKFQNMVSDMWSNRTFYSSNFIDIFGVDKCYFEKFKSDKISTITEDFFENSPLVYLYRDLN